MTLIKVTTVPSPTSGNLVVFRDLADTQMVIGQNFVAALLLDLVDDFAAWLDMNPWAADCLSWDSPKPRQRRSFRRQNARPRVARRETCAPASSSGNI